MPMDFPDMQSLEWAAKAHKFRLPEEGEPEETYRKALANHVESIDFIESLEIRNGVGWDKFTKKQNEEAVLRSFYLTRRN